MNKYLINSLIQRKVFVEKKKKNELFFVTLHE